MPPHSEAVLRYRIIDKCLTNPYQPFPSMRDLIREIKNELNADFSPNTIQKDIHAMKTDESLAYFAPIEYSIKNRGYYYSDPNFTIRINTLNDKEIETIELAVGIIQHFKGYRVGETFSEAIHKLFSALDIEKSKKDESLFNAIQPEEVNPMSGLEHFDIFLKGIKKKIPVSFIHYSYHSKTFKANIVHPYVLKESQKRWYVVGFSEAHKKIRFFGMDRIFEPVLLNKRYEEMEESQLVDLFSNRYGINTLEGINNEEPEHIELVFSSKISGYIKSMPIHSSQKVTRYFEDGSILVVLELFPTVELVSLILSYSSDVVVRQPKWLRERVQKELQRALLKNQNLFPPKA